MESKKIEAVEGVITAETLAEKQNVPGRGQTRLTIPVDDSAFISEEELERVLGDGRELKPFNFHVRSPYDRLVLPAAETPKEKSRLIYVDEPAFIPDTKKVQNHSQSGRFGKGIEVDDNPGEYYRHEITPADLSTKHIELDSASELVNAEKPAIEHPVVSIVVSQEENSVTATYGGKTLIERNPGDWFVQGAFQVNHVALRLAWKTKFKEVLPSEFQTSFSFNGGFSMGGKRNLFTAPPARPKRVSKHASGQSKKKKRK